MPSFDTITEKRDTISGWRDSTSKMIADNLYTQFANLVSAGFTEDQAITLLVAMIGGENNVQYTI